MCIFNADFCIKMMYKNFYFIHCRRQSGDAHRVLDGQDAWSSTNASKNSCKPLFVKNITSLSWENAPCWTDV